MSTSIKIPMVEPDENVGILDEENQEKSLEQKQHEIYGLTIAEYDGIDKLFTMLTGSLKLRKCPVGYYLYLLHLHKIKFLKTLILILIQKMTKMTNF